MQVARPAAAVGQNQVSSVVVPASKYRAVLDKYCVTCHNARLQTAGLELDRLHLSNLSQRAEIWEKVVRKLRGREMPPAGRPRPDPATYDGFASWLETSLDAAAVAHPNPGRPALHRLNRTEYANTIRDLLVLEVDGRSLLPADESGYGFDNIADVLSITPALLERYMIAAQKISRRAIGDRTMRPTIETYRVSPFLVQEARMSDDLPFGSRGGAAIRHHFPLDGSYVLGIALQRNFNSSGIVGLNNREQLDVRLDGVRIKQFDVGGECVRSKESRCIRPPGILPVSEYERTADAGLEVRFAAKAGTRLLGITFVDRSAAMVEGAGPARRPAASSKFGGPREMGIDTIHIEGPFDATGLGETPSRRRIFVCRPAGALDEERCAERILVSIARRAYRRPVTDHDLQVLLGLYRIGRLNADFDAGVRMALKGLLVSPNFLLRVERDPANVAPGTAYRITDLELASRLSFFLWSSIPDDQLLDLAVAGKLKDPTILEGEVRRMLGDRRASALVSNFASQWLYLRDLRMVTPDPQSFPGFDDSLREAFQRETELFLESQLRDDRSILELLTANYTFVNERLARFYRIPKVYGSQFRRVTLNDPNRAGLLGHASILTVTSYSTRTSPVVRGKFLLDNILGSPPPPPPPDVPDLRENGEQGEPPRSVRARMEAHRTNAVCAGCHLRMDPMGFALENFNAIGKWRTHEANAPIDATGALPDGLKFDGPVGLRRVLLNRRHEFVRTFIEKLLTYALGRGVEYYDMPAIRAIIRNAAPSDYRWSAVILEIVKSIPFQMRTAYDPQWGSRVQ